MADEHDCLDYVEFHQKEFSENMDPEVDGAIDRWYEEWWQCSECGEHFTPSEVTRLQNEREVKDG